LSEQTAGVNPFASKFLRPGVVPFLFADGTDAGALVQRLIASGWWGQIVGCHGSGKSTLLVTLMPAVQHAGRQPILVTLHQGQRTMPALTSPLSAGTLLIVDGYEQLSWWSKWMLKRRCRRAGSGLLVTSHRDAGLPTLYKTSTNLPLLSQISDQLLRNTEGKIASEDLQQAFATSGGNLREALFLLYDIYQQHHPEA
jgi:hypothetical protein